MVIYLASDHAGFVLKEKLKHALSERGFIVKDYGANNFVEDDDYPEIIGNCIKQYMQETKGDPKKGFAIILGGSGTGEAIVANRYKGVRAVVYNGQDAEIVKLGRLHNNCNVLSIGARFVNEKGTLAVIKIFMTAPFEGGRHTKRVRAIDMLK